MPKIILFIFILLSCYSFSQVPNASFSSTPTSLCLGGTNNFTNTSSGGVAPFTYLWNFGDSTFSTLLNPSHNFANAGTYNVTLLTTTATGLTASASQQIIVQASPIPTFVAPINSNCAPASIFFNNTTSGGSTFLWNFGNGSTSNLENPPAQIYNSNGSYNVSLTVTTSLGCTGTTSIPNFITISNVAPSISADFEGGCSPLSVQFTDISIPPAINNPITSWSWDFGNGQTFNGQNPPAQLFTTLGFYNVSLSVTTQSGCTGTTVLGSFITVGQINSMNFTVDSDTNCIKTDFQFTSSVVVSPTNPGSTQINYSWDFNDGTSSTDTIQNPTYQFESDSGYFDVSLVVEYLGCRDTLIIPQMVYVNAPVAFFDLDTNLICNLPLSSAIAVVTDTSVHGLLSDNVEMIWQWGDGSPNTVLNDAELDDVNLGSTTHSYTNYGTYEIQQVINNITTGCSDTSTQSFFVSQISSEFSIPNDSICVGDTLQLTDLSNPDSTIITWVYNMGNTNFVNNGPDPTYAYPASGLYTISLVVTNDVGCSSSFNRQIKAVATPFAVISTPAADEGGCSPHLVTFLNLTQNNFSNTTPLDYFSWSFSDGSPNVTTQPVPNPSIANPETPITHTFFGEGVYVATLTAYNSFGCYLSASKEITLTNPNAFFTLDNIFCNGTILNTENLSVGVAPVNYEWYVDNTNGDTLSTDLNPNTPYFEENIAPGQTSAIHNLILIAEDINGCKDTVSVTFTTSIPTADFTENLPNSVACPPITGAFDDESTSYGTIDTWLWNFGNGNQSALQNPSNTYLFPGTYDVSLTVTDEYGCLDDTLFSNYLTIGGPSGVPFWDYDICSGTASFDINNQSNIDSALWNLDDGSTNSALSFNYVYDPGVYVPTVTLTDVAGCAVVYPAPQITISTSNAFGLTALFSATPNPVNINEAVTVLDQSSTSGSPITSWSWDFGNGQVSDDQNPPTTSYAQYEPYTITLTIENDSCTSTFSLSININPDIIPIIPNVFTPNGDDENQNLELDADYFASYVFTAINRWGNTVFEKDRDPAFPLFLWDGKTSSGVECTDGVYFYRLKGELKGGTPFDKTDFVNLIR